jgi:diacylglycerol kinase family enzyme
MRVLYSDDIYAHPRVRHYRGRSIVARSDERVQIEVDGEALGTLPLEFTILPGAIRVCRR